MKVGDLVKSTVTNDSFETHEKYGIIIETFCGVNGKPLEAKVVWVRDSFETHESCHWLEVVS